MGKYPETPSNASNLSVSVLPPTSHDHCSLGHQEGAMAVLGRLFLSVRSQIEGAIFWNLE